MPQGSSNEGKVLLTNKALGIILVCLWLLFTCTTPFLMANPASADWLIGGIPCILVCYWIYGAVLTFVVFVYFVRGD